MFVSELDSFVKKFHQLWRAGHNAHLDLDTYAGKAWVGLRLQLGDAPGPKHHQFHPREKVESPSRVRRRARRAAAKLAKNSSETDDDPANIVKEHDVIAENAKAEVDQLKVADKACKSDKEASIRTAEKVNANDVDANEHGYKYSTDHVSYCKVCEDGSDETNSEEDLAYHLMNNHEPEDVLKKYGKQYIEDNRYCVRRQSPFFNWFSTPPISKGGFSSNKYCNT